MTPSKRLKGPRGYSDASYDSPTKSKTVTFHSVPQVKEFEAAAGEGATPDGSFEMETQSEGEDEGDWADEDLRDDSLEDILHEPATLDKAYGRQPFRVTNPDVSVPDISDDGHGGVGDESATAEFMDTLISEGLFSPPELSTPAFEDYPHFQLPTQSHEAAPFLSTPSLGDSVHATPLLAGVEPELVASDRDAAGVPYGRTHHAERNAAAHAAPVHLGAVIEQPDMPHGSDHQMLMNGNAALPASAPGLARSTSGRMAHQSGPIPDPFLTIQTATSVLSPPQTDRSEGGIPLGRTSHIERMQAARMLATQSLGIGMPRSPAVSQHMTRSNSESLRPIESAPEEEDVDSEMLFDASFEMSNDGDDADAVSDKEVEPVPTRLAGLQKAMEREEEAEVSAAGRRLPKPPKVAEIKLPSPITSPSKSSEGSTPEERNEVSSFTHVVRM
jgi:hypothetical protein